MISLAHAFKQEIFMFETTVKSKSSKNGYKPSQREAPATKGWNY
jgi:hypothetical protein